MFTGRRPNDINREGQGLRRIKQGFGKRRWRTKKKKSKLRVKRRKRRGIRSGDFRRYERRL